MVVPQSPSSDPSTLLVGLPRTAPPNKPAVTFSRTVTSSREDRGHVPSAPAPRLQMHCAALIFSKKQAFPMQHALCGQLCFLLTSGTNSVQRVWGDCSPYEPLPCCDYSVPPRPPPTLRPHLGQAFYGGVVRGSTHGRTGHHPHWEGQAWYPVPPRASSGQKDKAAGKALATA